MASAPRLHGIRLSIRQASSSDLPALLELLPLCGLPLDGVAEHLDAFLLMRDADLLVGGIAVERYDDDGLLRSLAVHPDYRRKGLATRLTRRALRDARRLGLRRLFLLTETASEYFLHFGFRPIPREQAPTAVQASVEFASACPQTAVCMVRQAHHEMERRLA